MPCAPLPHEAGPRWTVFGIRAYHVDEVLEDMGPWVRFINTPAEYVRDNPVRVSHSERGKSSGRHCNTIHQSSFSGLIEAFRWLLMGDRLISMLGEKPHLNNSGLRL